MVHMDWSVWIPILAGALIGLRWTVAYWSYPVHLMSTLRGVDAGAFEPHVRRTASFVRICGHSHWIMSLRDVGMLGIMSHTSEGLHQAAIVVFWVTLVPLWLGASYSLDAAAQLHRDADAINRVILATQRLAKNAGNG